jgi:drug/metabolite transporter (DMT)-like permease
VFYSFLCATLWASTGIFVKFIDGLALNQIIFGRFFIGAILAIIFLRDIKSLIKPQFPIFIPSLMTLYYVSATYAFYYAPVAIAALFIAISPLFTLLIRLVRKDRIYLNEFIGFVVSFIGLVLYFKNSNALGNYSQYSIYLGAALATFSAFVRAVYSYYIWHKSAGDKSVDLQAMNMNTLIIGSGLFVPFVITESTRQIFDWNTGLALLGLGVLATFVPNVLNNIASKKINPTTHNIIGMTTPLTASLMAWVWLGEAQTIYSLLCMVVALLGVFISVCRPKKVKESPAKV